MKSVRIILLACIALILLSFSVHAFEDRIVAVVNKEAITLSDLDTSVELILKRMMKNPQSVKREDIIDEARKMALSRLIDEVLLKQEALNLKIDVTDEEVTATLNDMLARRDISAEEFKNTLIKDGVTIEDYKKEVRHYLLTRKIIEKAVRYKIAVSDKEIGDYYRKHKDEYEGKESNRIQQILIVKPKDSNDETRKQLKEKAELILERLKKGEPFELLAAEYSQGPAAKVGGDLGFVEKGMMYPEVDAEAFSLEKGELGDIVESPVGFHIIKVIDKKGAGVKPVEEVREEIMGRINEEKIEEKFQEWFKELKEKSLIDIRL
jgi:peptidyl-prolyl cis-trans isomerase SurA